MVVSNSKRKRKESPPPPPSSAIESSPEMPKRTKVQAQRKFAQGQNVPASYSSLNVASSSSNTGPSTSSESREPPTEILPNKRPKTEDFLTFLCFRGTPALPAHLDFLNQGKPKVETTVKKNIVKPVKAKKGKKGKTKNTAKITEASTSTSTEITTSVLGAVSMPADSTVAGKSVTPTAEIKNVKNKIVSELQCDEPIIPFAVRKRAEVVADGNRRSRAAERLNRNAENVDKCNNVSDIKRRSSRAAPKELLSKSVKDLETDGEEYFSANEDVSKEDINNKEVTAITRNAKKIRTPVPQERKSETPSKESETGNSKGSKRPSSVAKKLKDASKEEIADLNKRKESPKLVQKLEQPIKEIKEKLPVKRSRQKESPIFIPSPEPSGRMTRQRAFFEPVKVPHREEELIKNSTTKEIFNKKSKENSESNKPEALTPTSELKEKSESKEEIIQNGKINSENSSPDDESKLKTNIFDFSSDDEQPLAKSLKVKKGKAILKKSTPRSNKSVRKLSPKKTADKKNEIQIDPEVEELKASEPEDSPTKSEDTTKLRYDEKNENCIDIAKSKTKRGKTSKKKIDESFDESKDIYVQPSPKKSTNSRQARKKVKEDIKIVKEEENSEIVNMPTRNQRPTRKTKERATIYMGIIGHKLQLAEDDDDDLSLNSYSDLPNVKEIEKMESELKLKAARSNATKKNSSSLSLQNNISIDQSKTESQINTEKPATVRRGRPPKQGKQAPIKRDIEGEFVKKGSVDKLTAFAEKLQDKIKSDQSKVDSDDEDFLLNEEVNETKRKLEKSFSDSDDEPLAIKANSKSVDKDVEDVLKKIEFTDYDSARVAAATALTMLPLTPNPVLTPPMTSHPTNISPITTPPMLLTSQAPSPFKTIEKKSPVPTSKILNVPATYGVLSVNQVPLSPNLILNANYNKPASYLPQMSPHYHGALARTPTHQFPTAKSPTVPAPPVQSHITTPITQQSPIKYQTPPTTYPPPIEVYPSPKINPNFLTPKFDRTTLPRPNSFPSPSPVKFDTITKTSLAVSNLLSPKTPTIATVGSGISAVNTSASTSAAAAGVAVAVVPASNSADPLTDEIGSILAANLMPSKEESGKIFGIASVTLAQSSGPDNTKCTLGKCGSIHKPVLGPVVPTEIYIGDQLSSKERRKAKVNMTHEQIQKWLIECSSNPDEIQDDLDDDYDDNLRPNHFAISPPPTRDDKESTSFSSSSKTTRDFGKSESAWSLKGPSLKATPIAATPSRKEDTKMIDFDVGSETNISNSGQAINLTHKFTGILSANANENTQDKEKSDKKVEKKNTTKETGNKDNKQNKAEKDKEKETSNSSKHTNSAVMQHQSSIESTSTTKQKGKKNTANASASNEEKSSPTKAEKSAASSPTTSNAKTPKRTPVYNQKAQKQSTVEETTVVSTKKATTFSFGAFSVDNEKSIYSFDKYDEENKLKQDSKPSFRRQSGRESEEPTNITTPTRRTSTSKKRAAAAAAEKANKDIANASQNSSVSLTLSPSEKSKLIKVSLETENKVSTKTSGKKTRSTKAAEVASPNDGDSDSDGHTFYIPLQGSGAGGDVEGGIQGVAVKLGREGPEGPNQKVIMHATLVTKAQMGSNSKPLPESMNASDIVKTLMGTSNVTTTSTANSPGNEPSKKGANLNVTPSTSSAAAAVAAVATASSASNSLKSVPISTVQPRFKASEATTNQASSSNPGTSMGLVRVNSNSSLFSGSAKSRIGVTGATGNKKFKDDTPIKMANNTAFPRKDDPTQMVEAPIFRPTEKEFADPMEFIERITPIAARFGICKIVPPANFKPECRISDEMRFTAYNQYVHKMLYRWGPSAKELSAIKKYLATQSIVMNTPPWIGGMEVDLPRLYHTVQELGGLKEVIEKKKWARVAEEMCIPKLAQDRVTKLDDIYCKYLLPYDTLSPAERQKLFDEVEADWAKREARARRNADRFANTESGSNEDDVSSENEESEEEVDGVSMECIVKGRSMPLSQFYRIARNTMALWFKNTEPTVNDVEAEFWRHVAVRDSHVCVHSGSIDSSGWGYGFPSPGPKGKGSNYARHPWNLKVLTNNTGSVLRSLGPVMGVTVPTLHVGMLFSACCWYRDPHGLSWIEYLHTGASKLWYGIPDDQSANFRAALTSLIPTHCQNKTIWLPCDTVMVPPHMLTDRGVSLCRIEQKPGEFIVVFPRAYTSSLGTGYVVSESVYFATTTWLDLAKDDFRDIHESCEPAMFSLEQLLFAMGYDQRVSLDTLQQMLPMLNDVFDKETTARDKLKAAGITTVEKVQNEKGSKAKKQQQPPFKLIDGECDLCRANLYISMVKTDEGNVYCLQHALKNLTNGNLQAKHSKLLYAYSVDDIENLIKQLKDKVHQKKNAASNKKGK